MKTILMIAAVCAALCVVSPADAQPFDGLRERFDARSERLEARRAERVTFSVTVDPAIETEAVTAPERRLTLRERFQAYRAASKSIRAARIAK